MIKDLFPLKMKKQDCVRIYSPAVGQAMRIEKVKDQVFSEKLMGEGVAVLPENGMITVPVDGKVKMLFPTLHAFGIETAEGVEILVHIGLDTVNLNGEGFTSCLKADKWYKAGAPAINVDLNFLREKGYDTTVIMVLLNCGELNQISLKDVDKVNQQEVLMELKK